MPDKPTYDETTRAMASEYNANHKQEFRDVWDDIKLLRNRPPVWVTILIGVIMGLLGITTTLATINITG